MSAATEFIDCAAVRRPVVESTLPLINVVFLLLAFFLLAGSMIRPLARDISPVGTDVVFDDVRFSPHQWVYLREDGSLSFSEQPIALHDLDRALFSARAVLYADEGVRGSRLDEVLHHFQTAGADGVMLVTQRGLR